MVRAPCIVSFVLAVCCSFRHNAAIPLASHSADDTNQMQDVFKEEKTNFQNNWNDTTLQPYTTREGELSDISSDKDSAIRTYNSNYRGPQKKKTMHRYKHGNNQASVLTKHDLEDVMSREQLVSCTNDKKKNQRYSSSFFGNWTNRNLNVDKEFEDVVANNTKTKKTSSVHEGEDITLCWIETTTIKENKTIQPPRRLVIREYTISFENSATIPDKYLECKKLDGELLVNDPDVGKLALFEVIDEDTKVSRVVNFTSIGHIGDINVWQHKKVKCGVGPVVSKDIIEWNDDSENPKKRVELKVSPKLHKLTAKNEEEEPCTESSEESSTSSMDESTYVTDTTKSCSNENGTCEETTESNEVSTSYMETSTLTELPMISEASTEESEEDLNFVSATTSSSEEEDSTESSIATEETIDWTRSDESLEASKKDLLNCEDSSDPACEDITSQWELSTESSTTETSTQTETWSTMTWTTSTTTKETTSSEFEENSSEESSSDLVSDLETSLPTTSTVSKYDSVSELTSEPIMETTMAIVESTTIGTASGADGSEETEEEDKDLTNSSISSESTEDYYTSSAESTSVQPDKIDSSFEWSTVTSDESLTTESASMDTSEYGSTESTDEFLSTSEEETSESAFEGEKDAMHERTTRPMITEESISTTSSQTSLTESTTSPSTTSSEVDYICSENSEDCVSDSESCDESEDCSSTTCESGMCSEEQSTEEKFDMTSLSPTTMKTPNWPSLEVSTEPKEVEFTATTASTPIFGENDNTWTAIISVPTTVETRKSTPLSVSAPRHKLVLKIKVLLEHVNEKKEKESLVEVEKHLALDENPKQHHKHPDLLKQLKSFNDSINTEVINALLNCTSLANLTRDVNLIGKRLHHNDHSKSEELQFTYPTDLILQSSKQNDEELQNSESEQEHGVESRKQKRRAFADLVNPLGTNSMRESKRSRKKREQKANDAAYESVKSETESMAAAKDIERKKMEIVRRALPDISKDFSIGLQNVMSQLSQRNSISANDPKKIAKRNLLDIVVDPKDNRFLSRRRRAATEEVGRWTNERIRKLPVGGKFRSFTEFVLYDILS